MEILGDFFPLILTACVFAMAARCVDAVDLMHLSKVQVGTRPKDDPATSLTEEGGKTNN